MRRRTLLRGAASAAAGAAIGPWFPRARAALGASTRGLAKYVEALPLPGDGIVVATPRSVAGDVTRYAFEQVAITRQLHPALPLTKLWAYDDGSGIAGQSGSFGMLVVAHTGNPISVDFTNRLPERYPEWIPVDTRLTDHGDEVRVMTHLHGGFVAAASDGNPAVTPDGFGTGETQTVLYPNVAPQQPASLLWFHDHGMGTTRLNVFAGLAAAYLIRDASDTGDAGNANGLPSGAHEIPLVIQDRQIARDGTLLYPRSEIPGVTWVGEYFGDVMLVNGKVWPYLDVDPTLYRFRILNGCNARILDLDLGGAPMWQIGAEGGLWAAPVRVSHVVLAPAERADLLVDFSPLAGATTLLRNGRPRRPVVTPAPQLTQVMEIRVANADPVPRPVPAALVGGRDADLPAPSVRRFITLNETGMDTGEWMLTLNGEPFAGAITERPAAGAVEDWYYINLTGDTHPMHQHLVTHQVVGRAPFDVERYLEAAGSSETGAPGIDPTPFATGPMLAPDPTERGYKDTTRVDPGTFVVLRARYELPPGVTAPQRYVHHCHIVEHEDNEMMRPFEVA